MSRLGALALCMGAGALLGCANPTLGPLPRNFVCQGKATIVGSASGFSGVNAVIDCGDGFRVLTNSENSEALK